MLVLFPYLCGVNQIQNIIDIIDASIKEDADIGIMSGNIIRDGYDEQVDEFRGIISSAKDWLSSYTCRISEETGISNLKIKFTGASGYFIEISKSQISKVPESFIHKQTLVNAARYITVELKKFEEELLEAEGELSNIEYNLFQQTREQILTGFDSLKEASKTISYIDFIASLSESAYQYNYVKPEIQSGYDLDIQSGRHPVIETIEKEFISNDLMLDSSAYIHTITGPNMGGKSTFLRQNALIILLAHIGSFVPAKKASIPLTDKIFSRVGAMDNLFLGESTFMVEMQEVANILHNSTQKSFVIIDEVGRGTSTYDGMSLAWAILKQNHDKIKAKTLFATHYHELIDEAKTLKGVANFSVAVGENNDTLVFLRKIIAGGIKKSFGIEVAKLAGISDDILIEAKKMLRKLQLEHAGGPQLSLGSVELEPEIIYRDKESEVENKIGSLDMNNITPLEALNLLGELQNNLHKK